LPILDRIIPEPIEKVDAIFLVVLEKEKEVVVLLTKVPVFGLDLFPNKYLS